MDYEHLYAPPVECHACVFYEQFVGVKSGEAIGRVFRLIGRADVFYVTGLSSTGVNTRIALPGCSEAKHEIAGTTILDGGCFVNLGIGTCCLSGKVHQGIILTDFCEEMERGEVVTEDNRTYYFIPINSKILQSFTLVK